jgi:hypothetical protein
MIRKPSVWSVAAVALTLVLSPGCATILGMGSDQEIKVTTNPDGAAVFVDGVSSGKNAPTTVALNPKDEHSLYATLGEAKSGSAAVRKKVRIWAVIVDGILTAGLGVLVDYMTGALYMFDPSHIQLNLGVAPPPSPPSQVSQGHGTQPPAQPEKLAPCPICGEPRGNAHPCPHCGMD